MQKNFRIKRTVTVLDYGPQITTALVGGWTSKGSLEVLGGGECQSQGIHRGRIVNLADAAETVLVSLRKAERSTGHKAGTVYYNFDDPEIESVYSWGSKVLRGEGEVTASDIEEANASARRLLERYESRILYSKEIRFIVDDRDELSSALGIFGKKLDVLLHALRVRSEVYESWKKIFRRCYISKAVPVLSSLSTAYGVVDRSQMAAPRIILDLGSDYLNIFIFKNETICELKSTHTPDKKEDVENFIIDACRSLIEKYKEDGPDLWATNLLSENEAFLESLSRRLERKIIPRAPQRLDKLAEPKYAALVGLFYLAEKEDTQAQVFTQNKWFHEGIRDRIQAFINEYF